MRKFSLSRLQILSVCLLFTITSCKKFIEIPSSPPDKISEALIFKDSASVMSAVAGVYVYYNNGFGFQDGNLSVCTSLSADEINSTITYNTDIPQFNNNKILPDNNGYNARLWSTLYASIYKVNVCIAGISGSNGISTTLKQQLLGEMKVVRALYYFNLVNLYGGVPLVTSVDYRVNAILPKASVDEVYGLIISDLLDAKKVLKSNYPSAGKARPNSYTVSALLAKVYFYQGKWKDAYDMASEVIDSHQYRLVGLDSVFLTGSAEAIWQLPAKGDYTQTSEATAYIPYANNIIPPYLLTNSLIDAFEDTDERFNKWVGKNNVVTNGVSKPYYYPFKYKNRDNNGTTVEDFMILRLAEQYLIRAEASAESDHYQEALDDLNAVRKRANLLKSEDLVKENILANIRKERRVEFFTEWGNRWFDLRRTGKINEVLGPEKPDWKPDAALYPIPDIEIKNNPKLIQNTGY